jgi:hypothetical protein
MNIFDEKVFLLRSPEALVERLMALRTPASAVALVAIANGHDAWMGAAAVALDGGTAAEAGAAALAEATRLDEEDVENDRGGPGRISFEPASFGARLVTCSGTEVVVREDGWISVDHVDGAIRGRLGQLETAWPMSPRLNRYADMLGGANEVPREEILAEDLGY